MAESTKNIFSTPVQMEDSLAAQDITGTSLTVTGLAEFAQLGESAKAALRSFMLEVILPVGTIVSNVTDNSPAALVGGEWERIKDKFLLAGGDIYPPGSTGGEAEHTLTVSELPAHSHPGKGYAATDDTGEFQALIGNGKTESYSTADTGGNQPHNNMPPYAAEYVWKRVA